MAAKKYPEGISSFNPALSATSESALVDEVFSREKRAQASAQAYEEIP
jgi:hypothetical protein